MSKIGISLVMYGSGLGIQRPFIICCYNDIKHMTCRLSVLSNSGTGIVRDSILHARNKLCPIAKSLELGIGDFC